MEKEFGLEENKALAERLSKRANAFVSDADDSQSEGMEAYLSSQKKSLEQTDALLNKLEADLTETAKSRLAAADKKASANLLETYGAFGLKEI